MDLKHKGVKIRVVSEASDEKYELDRLNMEIRKVKTTIKKYKKKKITEKDLPMPIDDLYEMLNQLTEERDFTEERILMLENRVKKQSWEQDSDSLPI